MASKAARDLYGAIALLNRSIPMADEAADGVQALENLRSGRARSVGEAWDLARAQSGAAAQDFEQRHPVGGQLVKGSGLAVQAIPFLAGGAPVAMHTGMIGQAGRGAVAGGLGAQVGGLASEGDATDRVRAANEGTIPGAAVGALLGPALGALEGVSRPRPQPRPPVAALTGEEVGPLTAEPPELRQALRAWFDDNLMGRTVPMGDPSGPPVGFNRTGFKKATSYSANPDKMRAFPALPDVIGKGRVVSEPPIKDGDPRIKGYHIVDAPITIAGEGMPMRVVVRETPEGHFYYDHAVRSEGPAPSPGEPSLGRPTAGTPATKPGLPLREDRTLNRNMGAGPLPVNERSLWDRVLDALVYGQGAAQGS